ncbi:MAG: short chain dehydrogenase [Methanoregulaceae archaeon PtaU1.Bin059]|nr:MAG: short chain dehydrogenase [Methanoregulaceae archaeon PtaB.Bin152]OPY43044.1 MAG: short chain dehydrogenase [Methanoregulaceae archaeon PtaU1.Bin059]
MSGRVILVTGSTDGIGKATARQLAAGGAAVIVHGRDPEKGRQVIRDLKGQVWNRDLDLVTADFTSLEQVRRMAAEVSSRYSHLDVLVNNAGTYEKQRSLTPDGNETTFAVNSLAPFLLTHELLPLLRKGHVPRVVNITSIAHREVRQVDWENLHGEKRYDAFEAYALSALAQVVLTFGTARRIAGSGVSVNCLHPGVVATRMLRAGFPGIRGNAPREGAKLPVYLALSPDVEGVTGEYFEESVQPTLPSDLSRSRSVQERMWEIAAKLIACDAWSRE